MFTFCLTLSIATTHSRAQGSAIMMQISGVVFLQAVVLFVRVTHMYSRKFDFRPCFCVKCTSQTNLF